MARILVIEDDLALCDVLQVALRGAGYDVEVADGHATGLAALTHAPFDLIMTDSLQFKPLYGAFQRKELNRFQRAAQHVPIVLYTGYPEAQLPRAEELGFAAIWQKPMSLDELLDGIEDLLGAQR